MKSDHYHIFTHNDLDGVVSLLVFKWFHPQDHITFRTVSNLNVETQISDYLNRSINPSNIYLMDISLRESLLPFDLPNFTIIDHHKRSEEYVSRFNKARIIYKDYTSNTKLLYKILQKSNFSELSNEKKMMVLFADDYDSGNHQIQDAYDLNILYWIEYQNDTINFIKDYQNGWVPFTSTQQKTINNIKLDAVKEANRYNLFIGTINVLGKELNCLATFGNKANSISLDILMREKRPDIFFYINTEREKVTIRQNKSNHMIDLAEFARKYCDGNGNQLTAGGKPTDIFMELTKNLKAI